MIEFCGDDYMRDNSPETYIATEPNPKKAFGDKKPQLQLVPLSVMTSIAKALAEGSEKYGGYNWRSQPVNQMVYEF